MTVQPANEDSKTGELDEMDEEVLAIRKNARLMAYIDACVQRARKGPCKSIEQIRAELGIPRRKRKSS